MWQARLGPTSTGSTESCSVSDFPRQGDASDVSTLLSLEVSPSGKSACVVVEAIDSVSAGTVTLYRYADGVDTVGAEAATPALERGDRVARELAVTEDFVGDVGLTASLSVGDSSIGSTFVAVRATEDGFVTAPTLGMLDDAELRADLDAGRLTEAEYRAKLSELNQAGSQ